MWKHRIAVFGGGATGGVFWLLTQIVGANTLTISAAIYPYALVGGVLAAGIAVYGTSDFIDHSKLDKLFFVSAVAGLSFPSIFSTIANARDVAQIQGTNKQVQRSVDAVQQQISSPSVNPTQVAQDIQKAGATLSTRPASTDVKLSYDAVSRTAINSLSTRAQHATDPSDYVKAIEQIGTVPQFHSDATTELVQLSASTNPQVSAAAKPALVRLNYRAIQFSNALASAPKAGLSPAQQH